MIAIVDCNNFYASCERAFNPFLRGKPVCVLSNNDGCVISRSDEAKELGIPMGAPYHLWKEEFKIKGIYVFSGNHSLYADMSARVMKALRESIKEVEVYSIDEAFLNLPPQDSTALFCEDLAQTVYRWTGIPVSIGLAGSKTLAKAANVMGKKQKRRAFHVTPQNHEWVLGQIPIHKVWGIGRQHSRFLMKQGVDTALDFTRMPEDWIKKNLKTPGLWTALELKGRPCFPFRQKDEPKKHILSSRSFGKPLKDKNIIAQAIAHHVANAAEKLRRQGGVAGRMAIFISTDRFSVKLPYARLFGDTQFAVATADTPTMIRAALKILDQIYHPELVYQKSGISLASISPQEEVQLSLWQNADDPRRASLLKTIDDYNRLHGKNTLFFAAMGTEKEWVSRANFLSPKYTTRFSDLLRVKI